MPRYTYKRFTDEDKVIQENEPTYFIWYLSSAGVGTDGSGDKWVDTNISGWVTHAIAQHSSIASSTAVVSGSNGTELAGNITSKEVYNVIGTKYFSLSNPSTDYLQWNGNSISSFYTVMIDSDLFLDRLRQSGTVINLKWTNASWTTSGYSFRLVNESTSSTVSDPSEASIYYATDQGALSSTKVGTAFLDDGILCFMDAGSEPVTGLLSAVFDLPSSPLTAAYALPAFINNTSASSICQGITANSIEYQNSWIYFCEAKNSEFNYSLNNTWSVTASSYVGTRRVREEFSTNPKTYVTGVGLYDDNGNCLAVGKVNIPRLKDKYNRTLFKIKITL